MIRLKFSDINWETGVIHYQQQKTCNPLCLPLTDEVKYPLLDYIKNGRHESSDPEYIFVTMYAPYTKFNSTTYWDIPVQGQQKFILQWMKPT